MADVEYQELPEEESDEARDSSKGGCVAICCGVCCSLVIILALIFVVLWPRNPRVELVDVDFEGLKLNTTSGLHLDVNLKLRIQVKNPNLFGVEYDRLTAFFYYHGDELGSANSSGGTIPARKSVNLTADLKLESLEILKNAGDLISDAARDRVPVTASADLDGGIRLLSVSVPLQVSISCYLVVDPSNSSILSKDCEKNEFSIHSSGNNLREPELLKNGRFLGTEIGSQSFWYVIALLSSLVLLIVIGLVWIVWPRAPEITLEEVQLQGFSTDSKLPEDSVIPEVILDVNMMIFLGIRNRNVLGVSYDRVTVYVYYYGYELCKGELSPGEIPARDKVTVGVTLNLRGAEIVYNSAQLLTDLAKREVPMNTVIEFSGRVGIWKLKPHIKASVAYDLTVDPVSYEILKQDYHFS